MRNTVLVAAMSESRKKYQRQWVAEKRRKARLKKMFDNRINLSSSDSEDELHGISIEANQSFDSSSDCLNTSMLIDSDETNVWDDVDNLENEAVVMDSDSDSDSNCEINDLISGLRTWTVDCNVTHRQLNQLLPLLKRTTRFSDLPLCAKTLLCTSHDVICSTVSGGDYVYFGIKAGLECIFKSRLDVLNEINAVELVFNIDGLPLFASSTYSLWPILCHAVAIPGKVFVVSLYGGKSKPKDLLYINDMVGELKSLMSDGVLLYDVLLPCLPKMCVCDAPARAMVKSVKLFSGYYGCDKCDQKGVYIGRMTYPECTSFTCRTDVSFRSNSNKEHHNGESPFLSLSIDMIKFFPIDYMHQVCLGVTKRLIKKKQNGELLMTGSSWKHHILKNLLECYGENV
jgi:hypothetical protein